MVNYVSTFIYPSLKCWLLLRREKVDLIHLNNTLCRPHEWMLAAVCSGTKIVAHERGINQEFSRQAVFWARRLSAIVCISDAVKGNLIRSGFAKDKLVRIYNGLDPEKFAVAKEKDVVLRELGIRHGNPLIGVVGNIKQWKGQEVVIRALKRIRDTFPNVKCLIVGHVASADQWYLDSLKALIRDEGLEDAVIFTGARKDVADLVNCMSVLIHASVEPEPFGRVLLEGMALKRPVISTRIGAPLEIVVHGKTGILVSPGNPEELAEAVATILSDPVLGEKMGHAGHERLLSHFTLKRNCDLTESLYARVLGLAD
jgi:glycosyltransferase involved in cell wall biosynthesis